jgi:2-polyprenyl-3-methyl-5-hydroxy-6-metoxy-1,4-benzoquinol methylase
VTSIDWEDAYAQGTFDGADDVKRPGRYLLLAGLLRDCASVLDVGCGIGLLARFVTQCDYTGIDVSQVAIEKATRARDCRMPWEIRFVRADAEEWVLPHGHLFDGVVLNEVLYYLSDPKAALFKYCRLLRPNGILAVSVFDKAVRPWRRNVNREALRCAQEFMGTEPVEVIQDGHRWSVLFMTLREGASALAPGGGA